MSCTGWGIAGTGWGWVVGDGEGWYGIGDVLYGMGIAGTGWGRWVLDVG